MKQKSLDSLGFGTLYDKDFEAQTIADHAQAAVAASAAVEVGARGVGAVITSLTSCLCSALVVLWFLNLHA